MASKLPKFGEWEGSGGENITVRFDNAAAQKKKKANGQMINPNDPQDNPDMFPQKVGPSSKSADPKGKRGGIPQFGAWENGDNVGSYTAVFDNVQKTKNGHPTALPNEPQMNRDIQAQARPQSKPGKVEQQQQEQRSKVPTFGGWENGDNVGGYTAVFENVQKMKNGQPTIVPNEPQMNRDMHPTARPQSKPAKVEHQQQEQRSKVPTFGSWDGGEGEFGYTECFDNVRKNTNKNGPTVTPEPSNVGPVEEGRPKVPQFGAWEEGDNGGAYTAYFEKARKKKNAEPVLDPVEPGLNRDVNNRARPSAGTKNKVDDHHLRNGSKGSNASAGSSFESASKYGKQTPGGQPPSNHKGGRLQQKTPPRGSQTPERGAAIPPWGGWRNDPSQAEGYTGAFKRAKEERNTPTHSNVPPRYNQHQPSTSPEPKKGCCFGWF